VQKEALKYILAFNTARPLPEAAPRTLQLPLDTEKITTLIGIRRSGKTYLLYETMRRLEARGVDRRQMLYLNFEDDRLLPIKSRELDLIMQAHAELYPEFAQRKKYIFFDEVQNAPRWETYVRRLHDTEEAQIFLTGSSSHLLARELATGLRGRSISYEVFPLSFEEFLAFSNLKHETYSRTSESRVAAALTDYLKVGGLPEVVLAAADLRPRILKEYVDLVFYKDLMERYRVSNSTVMRQLLKQCLGQPAALLTPHKVYNDFRSQGYDLSKDTLYRYLGYLEESYLIFPLSIADRSLRKRSMNPKKLHPVDWALGYPLVPEQLIDAGRKLETAVFLHWRRQREDLAYLSADREIDLVVNVERPEVLINVALSVAQPEAWEREIAALSAAGEKLPNAERVLVVQEKPQRKPPAGIKAIEAWRYLLGIK
jgi:predicted AAA+ superfamily ATPase